MFDGQPIKPKEFTLYTDEAAQMTLENGHLREVVQHLMRDNMALLRVYREASLTRSPGKHLVAALLDAEATFGNTLKSFRMSKAFKRLILAYVEAAPDYGLSKNEVAKKLGYSLAAVLMWRTEVNKEVKEDMPAVDLRLLHNDAKLSQLLVAAKEAHKTLKAEARELHAQRQRLLHSAADEKRNEVKRDPRKASLRALDAEEPQQPVEAVSRYRGEG